VKAKLKENGSHNLYACCGVPIFEILPRRQRVGAPTGTPTNSVGEASGLILKKHTPSLRVCGALARKTLCRRLFS